MLKNSSFFALNLLISENKRIFASQIRKVYALSSDALILQCLENFLFFLSTVMSYLGR